MSFDLLISGCRNKNLDDINTALSAGADPNFFINGIEADLSSPMVAAAAKNFIPGLERLHEAGGNVNLLCNNMTPLMMAAAKGHMEAGRWLLDKGAMANTKNSFCHSAISYAIGYEKIEFADLLIHVFPDFKQEILGSAPSYIDTRSGQVVGWLLQMGVSPELSNHNGEPWLVSVQRQPAMHSKAITRVLLEAGANVNAQDYSSKTALHFLLERHETLHGAESINNNISTFLDLLRAGASLDIPDNNGKTALNILDRYNDRMIKAAFDVWRAANLAHKAIAATPTGLKPLG